MRNPFTDIKDTYLNMTCYLANTVAKHQECPLVFSPPGVESGSLRWESVLYQWLLKCLVPKATKEFTSRKPSSPVSQPFTQLIQQVCSTNASRNCMWFGATGTLCSPCYHISSPHSFFIATLSFITKL